MATSLSVQEKLNPALWLATQAGEVALNRYCCVLQENGAIFVYYKLVQSSLFSQGGLILALFFFHMFMDLHSISGLKHPKTIG